MINISSGTLIQECMPFTLASRQGFTLKLKLPSSGSLCSLLYCHFSRLTMEDILAEKNLTVYVHNLKSTAVTHCLKAHCT